MIIDQAKCPNCCEIIDVFEGEEVIHCPVCEDSVFTQQHRVMMDDDDEFDIYVEIYEHVEEAYHGQYIFLNLRSHRRCVAIITKGVNNEHPNRATNDYRPSS